MIPVIMPQVGQDISRGKIVEWLKAEGDRVEEGEVVLVVESEKARAAGVSIQEFDYDGVPVRSFRQATDRASRPCPTSRGWGMRVKATSKPKLRGGVS